MPVFLTSSLVLGLALAPAAPANASPALAADCPAPATANAPPVYPEQSKLGGIGGLAVLRVRIDPCGRVLQVQVEQSSRSRELDSAAIKAVREWRLTGVGMEGDVLVPVRFTPDPAMTMDVRTRDEHFLARRSQRHALPSLDAQEPIPAYVPDQYGLGYPTVLAAYREIARHAVALGDADQGREQFQMIDDEGLSRWTFGMAGYPFSPFVVRERAVSDGGRGYWATSWQCDAPDASACATFESFVTSDGVQVDMAPPPEAPPLD